MRIAALLVFSVLFLAAGCPGPAPENQPGPVPMPRSEPGPTTVPAEPPIDMRASVTGTLAENCGRLEARLEWYRANQPGHPHLDSAARLLKGARDGIAGLDDVPEPDLPEAMHAVNSLMFQTELVIPEPE